MILIVDSNILFAALLKEGKTRELLIDSRFVLYAPETMLIEIRKYEEMILERSGFTKIEFETLLHLISEDIQIIEKERYAEHLEAADRLIGHIDKGDVPFLSLALSCPNDGIWTENARHFKEQDRVRLWKTSELIHMIDR